MRRLMLLRHSKAENDAPSGRDQDRRLDKRGRTEAAEIGGWIGRHPPFPDSVLVSPAIRAHQTWEIAWEAMKDSVPEPRVELLPELYGADPSQLLQAVRDASAADPHRLIWSGTIPECMNWRLRLPVAATPPDARRSPTICRHRVLPFSTLRSTTGPTWHSVADGWCSLSAQSC